MKPPTRCHRMLPSLAFVLLMTLLPVTVFAQATFTVNSEGDAGNSTPGNGACDTGDTVTGGAPECTLRAAIQEANDEALLDTINFNIPGGGVRTILPAAALPDITQPVIIDGSTQPGYSVTPVIELDGSNAVGNEVFGLIVLGGGSTIKALAINNFSFTGLLLKTGGQNLVAGNHIGTDAAGMADKGNGFDGLAIINSSHNVIGGATAAERNVISGNSDFGLVILNSPSTDNQVIGNYIGTDATGLAALGNGRSGVLISAAVGETQYASDNIIGGAGPGEENVISGNSRNGIGLFRSPRNQLLGNFIGVNRTGTVALRNVGDGINIEDAADNQIGGGVPDAGNVISGNGRDGIVIGGGLATGNQIEANHIGTDLAGMNAIANGRFGILLTSFGAGTPSTGTVIGSIEPMFGNVISGNSDDGIQIGFGSSGNTIIGNHIGTSADGSTALGNQSHGVAIFDGDDNSIGGTANGAENIISGNAEIGILIARGALGQGSSDNSVKGNTIGLGADGSTVLGNGDDGVFLRDSGSNTVGGNDIDSGNTISGNDGSGIHVRGADASANVLSGNIIGTDRLAAEFKANGFDGIHIEGSPDTVIGGSLPAEANIIAGNEGNGVFVVGDDATGTIIHGNFIGTNSLDAELGNDEHGILIKDSSDNEIGGTGADEGNTVAFNGFVLEQRGHGIVIDGGTGNAIRMNSVFSNEGRGINLVDKNFPMSVPYAFTLPDPSEDADGFLDLDPPSEDRNNNGVLDFADADTGSNQLQNYPVVTDVKFKDGQKTVEWTLYGSPPPAGMFTIDIFSNDEADDSGLGEGKTFIKSVMVTTNAHGHGVFSETFPIEQVDGRPIGPLVSTTATDAMNNTSEFSIIDTDGDSIADKWEELGIDINEDGVRDFPLSSSDLPLSSAEHKDIFVEVDSMSSTIKILSFGLVRYRPTAVEQANIVSAFSAVPNQFVNNADGMNGVTLHMQMDETILHHDWVGDADGDPTTNDAGGWPFYFKIKRSGSALPFGGFGTPDERANPAAMAAKRLFYRYAIFADHYGEVDPMTMMQVPSFTSGYADATSGIKGAILDAFVDGGNDFFVTLGRWPTPGGTPSEKTGTFMHEMGHTLGLMHGGVDHIHHKPNYHSVMNYIWQTPNSDYLASWRLDYSRVAYLPNLVENALNESTGLGGNPAFMVPIGPPTFAADGVTLMKNYNVVNEMAAINFDRDGMPNEPSVSADINNFGYIQFDDYNKDMMITNADISAPDTHTSNADWSALRFNFLGSPVNVAGVNGAIAIVEMDLELEQHLEAGADGAGELGFLMAFDLVDESAGTINIVVSRKAGIEGNVSVDFETLDGTAFAGLDYTITSGTLNFAQAEYSKSIEIEILDDGDSEEQEILTIELSNPQGGASLGLSSFTLAINANDGPGDLQFMNPFFDAQEDAGTATITVIRTGGSVGSVEVDVETTDSNALDAQDYTATMETLVFPEGVTSQTFTVPIIEDVLIEGSEGLLLTLSNPTAGAGLGPIDQAILTIFNVPTVGATFDFAEISYQVGEEDGLQTVEVVRSKIIDTEVSVEFLTADDSATAGEDYTATNVLLTFLPGEVSKMIDVPILSDAQLEGIEILKLKLVNPSVDAFVGENGTSEIRILDDESPDEIFADSFED